MKRERSAGINLLAIKRVLFSLLLLMLLVQQSGAAASQLTHEWKNAMRDGEHAFERGELSRARTKFEHAYDISRNDDFLNSISRRHLADCLRASSQYALASQLYTADIEQRSENDFSLVASMLGLAECADECGLHTKAQVWLSRAKSICSDPQLVHDRSPDGADVVFAFIQHYARAKQTAELEQAGRVLRKCINRIPGNHNRLFRAATISKQLQLLICDSKRYGSCSQYLSRLRSAVLADAHSSGAANDACVDSWILRCEYVRQFKATDSNKYLAGLTNIIAEMKAGGYRIDDPSLVQLVAEIAQFHKQLANEYRSRQLAARAKEEFDKCCAADPSSADGYVARGNFLWEQGQTALAISDLERAVRLGSKDSMCYTTLGHCYSNISFIKAKEYYMHALELLPSDYNALWGLGSIIAASGDAAKAVKYFDSAISLAPPLAPLYLSRAESKFTSGDKSGSKADLAMFRKLGSTDVKVLRRAAVLEDKLRRQHQ